MNQRVVSFIFICFIFVTAATKDCFASGGDLIWSQESNPSKGTDRADGGVVVDSSGIYVVGSDYTPKSYQWRIEKRDLSDGKLLWSQVSRPQGWAYAKDVAIDGSGIYIVGSEIEQSGDSFLSQEYHRWRIEKRSLGDGTLLWSQVGKSSDEWVSASDVVVDRNGIYVVSVDNIQWHIEKRRLEDGALVWSQSQKKKASIEDIAVDESGVYVVGSEEITGYNQWRVDKRNLTDGELIWSQGDDFSHQNQDDSASGVVVDNSGIYVVGQYFVGNKSALCGSRYLWRIEKRNLIDGTLIWFKESSFVSDYYHLILSISVDSNGVYIVGSDDSGVNMYNCAHYGTDENEYYHWHMEKRDLTDGALIWSKVGYQGDSTWSTIDGVAVDSSGIYVVGSDDAPKNLQWRIEKREK